MWLDCNSVRDIEQTLGIPKSTVDDAVSEKRKSADFGQVPESWQHFDVWQFATADKDSGSQSCGPPGGVTTRVDHLHMLG